MTPWLCTAPLPLSPEKLSLPAAKSSLLSFRLEATRPLTSTRAPGPKTMPLGLIRNTLPLDCMAPRIWLGSAPTTRLSTLLFGPCCTKRVSSPAPTEKFCQWMTAPGVLVMTSWLPLVTMLTWPLTIWEPWGLAQALPEKAITQAANSAMLRNRRLVRWGLVVVFMVALFNMPGSISDGRVYCHWTVCHCPPGLAPRPFVRSRICPRPDVRPNQCC